VSYSHLRYLNRLQKRLEAYRKQRGFSKREMAARLGITPQTYQAIESGKAQTSAYSATFPNLSTLLNLSAALEVDILELLPSLYEDVEQGRPVRFEAPATPKPKRSKAKN